MASTSEPECSGQFKKLNRLLLEANIVLGADGRGVRGEKSKM